MLIIKNICAKFHKKPNNSQKIKKKLQSRPQNTPKWPPGEEDLLCKFFFNAVSIGVIKKTSLQIFTNGFSSSQ